MLTSTTSRTPRRRLALAGVSVLSLALFAGDALAQNQPGGLIGTPGLPSTPPPPRELSPPIPPPPQSGPSAPLQTAIALLLTALVVGVNLIPSKRGHQD